MVVVMVLALALLLRVFAAWRLRPWSPLASADYLALPFIGDTNNPVGAHASNEREFCLELSRRSVSAQISGLRLFSLWRPLLLGGPPRLAAKSLNGMCIGSQGSMRTRKGEQVGLIGNGLESGWAVEMSSAGDRLVVWDLPSDEFEAQDRIEEAQRAASYQIERMREAQKEAGAAEAPEGQAEGESESPAQNDSDPFAAVQPGQYSDPFASGDSELGGDSGYSDPFDS